MMEVMQLLLELSSAIKEIKAHLLVLKQTRTEKFKQEWIDGQDVMLALKISKRTLQTLRDTGILPYSRINGKFYYKVADLEKLLESNYSRTLKNGSHD
jgi:hypothetical protein